MRVTNVELPEIVDYYLSKATIELVKQSLLGAEVEKETSTFTINIPNNNELFSALLLLKKKGERITIGNKMVYEYEYDISIPEGNVFTFVIDDQDKFKGSIFSVGNQPDSNLFVIFSYK